MELKKTTITLEIEDYKALKKIAIDANTTLNNLLNIAVKDYLKKR